MSDQKLEGLTLVQLRGIRREIAAVLENQATFSKQIVRLYEHVDKLTDEVRADFKLMKSDIIALENQNISRHGETIEAIRRIEDVERRNSRKGNPKDAK
jgi:hypothetical protein